MWLMTIFTFREAWHKKVFLVAGVLTLAFLILYWTGLHFTVETEISADDPHGSFIERMEAIMFFVMAAYLAGFLVAGLAILSAVGSIAGEIENGTLYTLAVRPLSRRNLLLGKYLGLAAMLVTYAALLFLALAGIVYWQTGLVIPGLVSALGFFILKPLVLLSITILGSTKLTTLGNGVFAFGLYALAIAGGMMEQIGVLMGSTTAIYAGVVTNLVLPADAAYRRLVATIVEHAQAGCNQDLPFINPQMILGPFGSHSTPSDWMLLYILAYAVFMLAVAVAAFKRRDI